MSFLNKLGKGVGAAAEKAKFEADKALKLNRMNSELGDLNNQLQSVTASIGAKVLELRAAGQIQLPDLDALFNQVETLKAQASAKAAEVEALRTMQFAPTPAPAAPAPAPSAAGSAPASFSFGSTETPPAAAPTSTIDLSSGAPSAAVPKFCPNCGTASEGAKFCPSCGQKLA